MPPAAIEPRASLAKAWHAHLATLDAGSAAKELNAVKAAEHFTAYLAKCREDDVALSSLLPGTVSDAGRFCRLSPPHLRAPQCKDG